MENKFKVGDIVWDGDKFYKYEILKVYGNEQYDVKHLQLGHRYMCQNMSNYYLFKPMKNTAFCIKVNSAAEKLATLYWMADLTKLEILESAKLDAINGIFDKNYPFIAISGNKQICGHLESFANKIFQFSELAAAEKFYNNEFEDILLDPIEEYQCVITKNYLAVGCKKISYAKLKEIYESAVKAGRIE